MEEKTKLTDDQKTENNETVELKDDDMSTITAGANNLGSGTQKNEQFIAKIGHDIDTMSTSFKTPEDN